MKKKHLKTKKCRVVNLERYSGKWVAFIDDQPVVCDKDLNTLMQRVKRYRLPKEPSIMLIPRKDEGPYILILT